MVALSRRRSKQQRPGPPFAQHPSTKAACIAFFPPLACTPPHTHKHRKGRAPSRAPSIHRRPLSRSSCGAVHCLSLLRWLWCGGGLRLETHHQCSSSSSARGDTKHMGSSSHAHTLHILSPHHHECRGAAQAFAQPRVVCLRQTPSSSAPPPIIITLGPPPSTHSPTHHTTTDTHTAFLLPHLSIHPFTALPSSSWPPPPSNSRGP